jgi:salicylate hydroxylase
MKISQHIEDPEKWALFDVLPPSTYAKDGFCILGDAAHASTPHLDAGAGFAVEDVHLLAGLMGPDLIKSSSFDIKQAFSVYDKIRRPRCQELIRRSRKQGLLLDLQGQGEVREEELRTKVGFNQKWVWDADLEDMLEEAKFLLNTYKETEC